jgi:hypothetical protein
MSRALVFPMNGPLVSARARWQETRPLSRQLPFLNSLREDRVTFIHVSNNADRNNGWPRQLELRPDEPYLILAS